MPNSIGKSYMLRTVFDELDFGRKQRGNRTIDIDHMPDVGKILNSEKFYAAAWHVQKLCWTVRRVAGRFVWPKVSKALESQLPVMVEVKGRPRIFVDITDTIRNNSKTGIQRVCRRIAAEGDLLDIFLPVTLYDGELYLIEENGRKIGRAVVFPGDIYLILGAFWEPLSEYIDFIGKISQQKVLVATCFYDIVPFIFPEVCSPYVAEAFAHALPAICEVSDIVCAISQTTLDDLRIAAKRFSPQALPQKPSFFFHLGADREVEQGGGDSQVLPDALATPNVFLSVGTIEPKKGYALALDAFDLLWESDDAPIFVIVGKYGWNSEALKARIEKHSRINKNLFWFMKASDAELDAIYRRSFCFIQASVAEGFGLPIIEAAVRGLPVIASDIDVFKEVGGDKLIYFRSEDAGSLAETISRVLRERPQGKGWEVPSWQTSALALRDGLIEAAETLRTRDGRKTPSHV